MVTPRLRTNQSTPNQGIRMGTQSPNSYRSLPSSVALSSCLLVLASILLQPALAFADFDQALSPEFNVSNPNSPMKWTLLKDNFTLLRQGHIKQSKYSTLVTILLIIIFMIVMVVTIVGTILVCIAVCLVRKLRRTNNDLIISLAVNDLCVALMVMPVATVYDIMGTWPFGPVISDFWVSSDVLSCTASILNLCMISIDRYYAITKPLEYGVKRRPKRMLLCGFIVWVSAACISLPPVLILVCSISQNQVYQVYVTMGTFYILLTVMVVVYYKISSAARKIVKDEGRAQSYLETHCYLEINVKNDGAVEAKLLGNQLSQPPPRSLTASTNTIVSCSVDKTESTIGRCFSGQRMSNEPQCPMLQHPKTPTKPLHTINRSPTQLVPGKLAPVKEKRRQSSESNQNQKVSSNRIRSPLSNFAQKSHITKDLLHPAVTHNKKLRFQLAKERKASTMLGIIMSTFVICWLPFFVLALIRPFVEEDAISDAISLLNPIIYAKLNRDFRKPFQEILFFRCSNLNHMMREEFYPQKSE